MGAAINIKAGTETVLATDAVDVVQEMAQQAEYRRHRPQARTRDVPSIPLDSIARCAGHVAGLFRKARQDQGLSHLALDITIQELLTDEGLGRHWQDGYTGKLERPDSLYGRSAFNPSFDMWLAGLGGGLVYVPKGFKAVLVAI